MTVADEAGPAMGLDPWIERARGGEAAAFEHLWLHFERQLYHLAYHHLGNRDDALDACQDAAADAWGSIRPFDGDAAGLRRWLIRIVVNASLDRARSENRRPRAPIELERDGETYSLPLPDPGQSPEDYAQAHDLRQLLESCLSRLSLEHRTLVLLDQLGLSYAEMADVTGVEVGTVKSRLSRARGRLRDLLTSQDAWRAEPERPSRRSGDGTSDASGGGPPDQASDSRSIGKPAESS